MSSPAPQFKSINSSVLSLLYGPNLTSVGFPGISVSKENRPSFDFWVRKIHWRKDRLPTPVLLAFPSGSAGKESACNVGDLGSIPGLGRSFGEGKGYPLQHSGLKNSMDYIVHGVMKSQTQMSDFHSLTSVHDYWKNHSFDYVDLCQQSDVSAF